MPNMRGGKAFKKGKKSDGGGCGGGGGGGGEGGGKFVGRSEENGEDYARVTRMLGNRRTICFCNDGKERICKIRGRICKGAHRQWIQVGDIVLISHREFGEMGSDSEGSVDDSDSKVQVLASGRKDISDIVRQFPREHWKFIRKDGMIHRQLFYVGVETHGGGGGDGGGDDDIFEFDGEGEGEGEDKSKAVKTAPTPNETAIENDDDIDIDAI
jgi:initiation factor 1A